MPNPNEDKLAQFVEDTVMYHAVKSILMSEFDANNLMNTPRHERDTALQACFDGRAALEKGFNEINKHRRQPQEPSIPNHF